MPAKQQQKDMPTVARMRKNLDSLGTEEITIKQAMLVFNVSTPAPIRLRIERGELAAAKVMGEWRIDVQSIHRYLDKVNKQFNKGR
ncbi:MAG: helix-turn-helix domain-containing protein [Kiritimatiellae bacterium]|nr:helix-turn-helix domain-containing protein [Kiritimatiellia bacterium]